MSCCPSPAFGWTPACGMNGRIATQSPVILCVLHCVERTHGVSAVMSARASNVESGHCMCLSLDLFLVACLGFLS